MSKKPPTAEDLFAELNNLSEAPSTAASKPSKGAKQASKSAQKKDALADLEELSNLAKSKPTSRPNTPKLKKEAPTPSSTGSARTSEERPANVPRKSGESTRSFHQPFTPGSSSDDSKREEFVDEKAQAAAETASSGGWWGWGSNIITSASATATAAVTAAQKQAEAAVKEIQKNEEAQRWAQQVKGNVQGLRGIGDDLRARAIPTFTSILHTLAPPISAHERLAIHTTHDLQSYPTLDPLVYGVFARVMAQVEGGDLMVFQRSSEITQRRGSDAAYTGGSTAGWNDGPWWRAGGQRSIGSVPGLEVGTKLVRATAESYANEFYAPRGGLEEATKQASQVLSESNPVRSSDIFLAIQAITYISPEDLFAGSTAEEKKDTSGMVEDKQPEELLAFAIYLFDPIHGITFGTLSQSVSSKWIHWLDAPSEVNELPEEIREIIEQGASDPREWVSEWIEETLSLSIGIVAQKYVARRMGVGEGGVGRGKMKVSAPVVDGGAGEAARAGVI